MVVFELRMMDELYVLHTGNVEHEVEILRSSQLFASEKAAKESYEHYVITGALDISPRSRDDFEWIHKDGFLEGHHEDCGTECRIYKHNIGE